MFNKVKRIAVDVTEELHQELKLKAVQRRISMRLLISRFIEKGLKENV